MLVIFVAGVTILPGVARADAEKLAAARATYQVARAMYDAGRYTEAAVELRRAFDMSPRTPLLRYIGDCYARTARFEEAVEYYTRYLNRAPRPRTGRRCRPSWSVRRSCCARSGSGP